MSDIKKFLSSEKGICIAPAGYGKTHFISECVNVTKGRQLILTHTHAGVSSLKAKLKNFEIPFSHYNIETITSYAQKYVKAFYTGVDIPDIENAYEFYKFNIIKANELISISPIKDIIRYTYTGLFVDEYQDCSLLQHKFILNLSTILPTRILGDHLQGIFNFNNDGYINLDTDVDLKIFHDNKISLNIPYRWKNGGNEKLGEVLTSIRETIESKKSINLELYKSTIEIVLYKNVDYYDTTSIFCKRVWKLLDEQQLLIMHFDSANINNRIAFSKKFGNKFSLIEAIDNKDFYIFAKKIDSINTENVCNILFPICENIFLKKHIKFLSRRAVTDSRILEILSTIKLLQSNASLRYIALFLTQINSLSKDICVRKEMYYFLIQSLIAAQSESISVLEAMKGKRNLVRRMGREFNYKCLGTTLLTKGLEFDTVAVYGVDKIKCPKNLYVALTRARKKLVLFTGSYVLTPNY